MPYKPRYTYRSEDSDGHEPCDIRLQLYPDEGFSTIVLRKEELDTLRPWQLCSLLNQAREQGREDAKRDMRDLLGCK